MSYPASSGYSSDRSNSWNQSDGSQDRQRGQTGQGTQFYTGHGRWNGYHNRFPDMPPERRDVDLGTNDCTQTFDNASKGSMQSYSAYDYIRSQNVWPSNRLRKLPKIPTDDTPAVENKTRRRCVIIIISCVTVLLFVLAAGLVYARFTCRLGLCNASAAEQQKASPCDGMRSVELKSSTNFTCVVAMIPPLALKISQGNANDVISQTNITFGDDDEHTVTLEDKMTVTLLKDESGDTRIAIEFISVTCETPGTYRVNVTDGTSFASYNAEVQIKPGMSFCPCEVLANIGLPDKIVCKVKDDAQESSQIHIGFGNWTIVSNVSISDVLKENGISQISNRITLKVSKVRDTEQTSVSLEFTQMLCTDDGMYTITIGNTTYKTILRVKSEQEIPEITSDHDELGGLVMGKKGEIQCAAKVGCSKNATLKVYTKDADSKDFEEMKDNFQNDEDLKPDGYYIKRTLKIESVHMKAIAYDKHFKCTYLDDDGKQHNSIDLYTKPIPEKFCAGASFGCFLAHPYHCTKFVRCTPKPVEMRCPHGLHFMLTETCKGQCESPKKANCNTEEDKSNIK